MIDSVDYLIGVGVCGTCGIIGAIWALLASYYARQMQVCRDAVQEAVDIMDDTRKES